jgi:hypothetical protein
VSVAQMKVGVYRDLAESFSQHVPQRGSAKWKNVTVLSESSFSSLQCLNEGL